MRHRDALLFGVTDHEDGAWSHAELLRAEDGLGKGTSWGRVLHRLFEAMLRVEALGIHLYAGNLLKDEERDAADLEEVMQVVEAVQSSSLWKRVKAADERALQGGSVRAECHPRRSRYR